MSSLTVAPRPRCSAISAFNAATSSSCEPDGGFDGCSVVGGVVTGGVGVTVGFLVSAGGVGVTVGFGLGDGVGLFVFLGFFAFFTVTVQVSFFFPILACTFALPFFLPLIVAAVLPFFFKVMYFLPDKIFHVTFFFVFFTLIVLLVPFVIDIFLLLKLTFFAADTLAVGIIPRIRAKERKHTISFRFVLIITRSSYLNLVLVLEIKTFIFCYNPTLSYFIRLVNTKSHVMLYFI